MEARDTESDVRANEAIQSRQNTYDLLLANMKRSQEALRVSKNTREMITLGYFAMSSTSSKKNVS